MKPVMYIFANSSLGMSPGKLAAQVAHAAVEAYRLTPAEMAKEWYKGGHYTKLVMDGGDEQSLQTIHQYLQRRDFKLQLIIDEGRTEIKPFTLTAIGVEIVDKDDEHTAMTFASFRTLKPPKRVKRTRWQRLKEAWYGG